MIDEVDRRLTEWANGVLEGVDVHLDAPKRTEQGRGIGLYLMELAPLPPPSTNRLPPLQVALRYLVTSWSDDPEEAHRLLGELVFAAMRNSEFQVELGPVPADVWAAFGVPPRPSFVLRVPLQQRRPEPKAKLVRTAPMLKTSVVSSLHGVVYGPNDTPLAGAEVQIPALRLTTHTDHQGRFYFATVPGGEQVKTLRVKAKDRELSVTTQEAFPHASEPLLIRFDTMED
ncbi:MAG TPA: Pvc16 family protein [Terriglobia bacterium]|nr:Pvc16 family protein [Terriglobia bacterium]